MPHDTVTRVEMHALVASAFSASQASIDAIRQTAKDNGARPAVLDHLDTIPRGTPLGSVRDLWRHFPDMPTGV